MAPPPDSLNPPKLELLLLGRFEVRAPDGEEIVFSLRRARALLAYLLIERRSRHSRDQLATLLWGESQQQQARQSLRQLLSGLRKGLPESVRPCLTIEGDAVSIDAARIQADVMAFEAAAMDGTPAGAETAAALYRGSFLAGLDVETPAFAEWLLHHRERLQDMAVGCLSRVLAQQVEAGKLDRAVVTGTRILGLDPLREEAHRGLMEIYARQGQRSLAIRQYQRCAELLERELGVQPEPATKRLYMEVNRRERTFRPESRALPERAAPAPETFSAASAAGPTGNRDETMVGRQLEAAAFREALATAAAGRGNAVVITGEAGIGKTRLIRSVLGDPGAPVTPLLTGASELESHQPFGPWLELLRSGALGEPVPLDVSGLTDHGLFERVRALTGAPDLDGTLVLAFEDVQWLDSASLETIVYLANRLAALPLTLVVSAREEELPAGGATRAFVDWLRRQPHTLRLALGPLPAAEVDTLIDETAARLGLAQPAAPERSEIHRLADGSPGVVDALVVERAKAGPAAWRLPFALPDRIVAGITARLDRLDPTVRAGVDAAAVLGASCEIEAWQRLAGLDSVGAVHVLDLLVTEQLIEMHGSTLRFRRERDRLSAYRRLPPARRTLLHAEAIQALRDRAAADLRPWHVEIHRHAVAAGRHGEAAVHALRAAEFAIHRGELEAARAHAEAARGTAMDLPAGGARDELLADIDLCVARLAQIAAPPETLDPVIERLKSHEQLSTDDVRRSRLALLASALLDRRGRRSDAILKGREALRLMGSTGPHAPWTPGDRLLLRPQMLAGQFESGIHRLMQSVDHARRIGDRHQEAIILGTLGLCHAVAGRFADALPCCRDGRTVAEALGDGVVLAACLQLEAQALAWHRDPAALDRMEEALAAAHRSGDLPRQYLVLGHRGQALLLAGDDEMAVDSLRKALDLGDRLRADFLKAYFGAWLAEALVAAGSFAEAVEAAGMAARLATAANEPLAQSVALRALGAAMVHGAPADPQEPVRLLAAALAMQEGMQITVEVARTLIVMSDVQRRRNSSDAAKRSLERGRTMFGQMGIDVPALPLAPRETGTPPGQHSG